MDFTDFGTELNIALGDTDDFTFTPEEKSRALTEAFNDTYTVKTVWDSTQAYSYGTSQYPVPTTMDTVKDIYIKADNNLDEPEKISSTLWEVIAGNIQFKPGSSIIPDGYTLYIKGNYKYGVADTVTESNLQEYILTVAQFRCLKLLGTKKLNRFLKNDTSVNEIVTWKRDLEQDMMNYRKRLPTAFEAG